ncbi:MAG: hypothetical protein ACREDQ_10010, partial [Limisphaerales bacterium]
MKKLFLLFLVATLLPLSRLAVVAQSAPLLQITNNNGQMMLSWPATNAGFGYVLQLKMDLSPSNAWTGVPIPPALAGNRMTFDLPVVLSMANHQMFFRLVQQTPIFQFAIFYNMDMEICPGANMTVNGKTYVNGNVWADPSSPATLVFGGRMDTTASNIFYTRSPNDQQSSTINPTVIYLDTNSPVLNAPPMILPAGTNIVTSVAVILGLPPPGLDPNSFAGQAYFYNVVDIIVSNSSSGTISALYQNSNNVNQLTRIPFDMTNVVDSITNRYYSFATNTSFYDYRESKTVKAVQLNVGAFNSWLTGPGATYNRQNNSGSTSKGHSINSIYIYNNAAFNGTQLPAVRLANGATLPLQGLTVATPFPIYVLGNYNASGSSLNNGTNVVNV